VVDVSVLAQFLDDINPTSGAIAAISGEQYRSYGRWPPLTLNPLFLLTVFCFAIEADLHHRLGDEIAKLPIV
jgi:hypothetical protein